jgi:hypothetical protein
MVVMMDQRKESTPCTQLHKKNVAVALRTLVVGMTFLSWGRQSMEMFRVVGPRQEPHGHRDITPPWLIMSDLDPLS